MKARHTGPCGSFLLSITLLAGAAGFSLMAGTAQADCAPAAPADGGTVICTGSDTDGFGTVADAITVNVLDGASLSGAGGPSGTIQLGVPGDLSPGSTVNVYGGSAIDSSAATISGIRIDGSNGEVNLYDGASVHTSAGSGIGIRMGNGGLITLNDHASIGTDGTNAHGIFNSGTNSFHAIVLNDNASVTTGGFSAIGLGLANDNGSITLNDNAAVSTSGQTGHGILVNASNNGSITLNDNASVRTSGDDADGVVIDGNGNTVTLDDSSTVATTGTNSIAVNFTSGSNTLVNYGTLSSTNSPTVVSLSGGTDTVQNNGTIFSGMAIAIALWGGDDQVTLGTGSNITGTIDGGVGTDTLTLTGHGSEDDVFLDFDNVVMNGKDWSLSGGSSFVDIDVDAGRLAINGAIAATGATTILGNGTLGGNGTLTTPGVTSSGTIAPGNSVGTLNIVGTLAQTGGSLAVEFDQSGIDRTNVTGAVTLTSSPAIEIIPLHGAGGASGVFLHSDTSITGAVGAVNYQGNGAATVFQTGTDLNLIAVDGTGVVATNFAALQTGLDYLNTVNGVQLDQQSDCLDDACAFTTGKRLWARGFGRFGEEDAQDGNAGYDYRNAGTAFGGDIDIGSGFTLGGSLGYANTKSEVDHNAAEAEIDGGFAALYVTYETGDFFVTGIASGGLQQFDLERRVAVAGGTDTARADTDGFLVGGSLQAGFRLDFPGAWRLTPSAGVAYQYQSVDDYSEHGAGSGNVDVGDQDSNAVRLNAQLNVARTIAYNDFSLIPHVRVGIAGQFNNGDDVAGGFSNGESFTLAQQDGNRVMGLAGAGLDIAFAGGITANIDYDAQLSNDGEEHAVIAGITLEW